MVLLHIFRSILQHEKLAFEIGVQDTVQILPVHFIHKAEVKNPGVVDKNINPSEFRSNLTDKPFDLLLL